MFRKRDSDEGIRAGAADAKKIPHNNTQDVLIATQKIVGISFFLHDTLHIRSNNILFH